MLFSLHLTFASLSFLSLTIAQQHSSHPTAAIKRKRNWDVYSNRTELQLEDPAELQKRDGTKYVFMHHIVGNTYPYTYADWLDDIDKIAAKGVDAIALNIGSSDWQRTQVASAYAAAKASGTGIKLFYSFDMTEMPCDLGDLVARVNLYKDHSNQFKVNGKVFISSFSGDCLGNSGWQSLKDQTGAYLMPFIWGLENNFGSWPSLDSWQCWGCAWPQGNYAKNLVDDNFYISQIGTKYAATISPWMYTKLSYKNWYLRGDDWLIVSRWEQLMQLRSTITFAELVAWNDYGESSYLGPIKGALPEGMTFADGYPHTAWYDLSQYYIKAFQTGVYPAITNDVIYFWARPHPASATASGDSYGKPSGWDWTEDSMWAAVFATSPATVILKCGSSSNTFTVTAGVNKLKLPLPVTGGKMTVQMIRNTQTIVNYTPNDYTYVTNPVKYNYNAWVGAATATATATTSTPTSASSTSSSSSTSSASSTSTSTSSSSSSSTSSSTSSSASPTATTGWVHQGCYVDADARVLPQNGPLASSSMTISTCQTRCTSGGYSYAGVENGNECFCSNTIKSGSVPTTASDCSTTCAGKATEICGGGWRINVYKFGTVAISSTVTSSTATSSTTPAPTTTVALDGWSYKGCYVDAAARVLPDSGPITSDVTSIATCLSRCQSGGYAYAGVENGNECYCSNTLKFGAVLTSESDCSTHCSCPSAPNDICGGSWRINIYHYVASTSSSAVTSSSSSSTSSSSSSSSSTSASSTSTSSSSTSSSSTSSSTSSSSSSSTSTAATVTATSNTWNSYGCMAEGTTGTRRALTAASFSAANMTPKMCQALCSGYQYSGVEASNECYCGNSLTGNGAAGAVAATDNCNWACSGDSTQKCGGSWFLNVYSKTLTTSTATWSSAGCFVDAETRMLRGLFLSQPGTLTIQTCTSLCNTSGFTMAAMEYGEECYCGSQLYKEGGAGVAVAASQCNMPCNGNTAQVCGAGWRGNLYLKSGTTL